MPGPIDPIRPIRPTPRTIRQARDEEVRHDGETPNLPVPVEAPPAAEMPEGRVTGTTLDAHLLAQNAQKRGLRAPDTLETARATYLETEWSGPHDRRLRKGLITKTEI